MSTIGTQEKTEHVQFYLYGLVQKMRKSGKQETKWPRDKRRGRGTKRGRAPPCVQANELSLVNENKGGMKNSNNSRGENSPKATNFCDRL